MSSYQRNTIFFLFRIFATSAILPTFSCYKVTYYINCFPCEILSHSINDHRKYEMRIFCLLLIISCGFAVQHEDVADLGFNIGSRDLRAFLGVPPKLTMNELCDISKVKLKQFFEFALISLSLADNFGHRLLVKWLRLLRRRMLRKFRRQQSLLQQGEPMQYRMCLRKSRLKCQIKSRNLAL